jgi:polar amino acid transport system substrate-binding protein
MRVHRFAVFMKQVIQNFKTGDLYVDDVPIPSLSSGFVLVHNHFSLISAGTERSTVSTAQASLIGKARQRPDLVKQVLETLKKEGFAETWKRVRTKLDSLKELGYSSAGTVLASLDTNGAFKPGDRVACGGGGFASHAAIVSIPQNLLVKVPSSVPLEAAAFTTLGSIALQGVRQANPRLGDLVCVIGLGLLGQITAQILRANGCQVFGIDTSEGMVELASKSGCHRALTRGNSGLNSAVDVFTEGRGFDAVIITAAAQSADPVELATELLRQKGVMVIVGAVPMNIPREPHFYKKELELKISCSYGPGRYDPSYEEGGQDYPYGYVRWTENRNMAAFVKLLENKALDLQPLTTHVFDIEKAEEAYDMVTGKTKARYIGILLKYPEVDTQPLISVKPQAATCSSASIPGIGFIGAGSFAQKFLIPNAKMHGRLVGVVTSRGVTAKSVGEKFGFGISSTDPQEILANPEINAVFIATRHNSHARYVLAALEAGKSVFVEKPLAIEEEDLEKIVETARRLPNSRLMVGFNRRFSPLALEAKKFFSPISEPLVINYRVNAGFIPKSHWIQTEEGGGRIIGEVCHFIDLLQFLTESAPTRVFAECVSATNARVPNYDNVIITLRFQNGSVGQISYLACGDKALSKERVEIFGRGQTFIIDDFRTGERYCDGSCQKVKLAGKGHKEEVELFLRAVREELPSPISLDSIRLTTDTTFKVIDSLRNGIPQQALCW